MKKILTLTMNPTIDKNSSMDHLIADSKIRCDHPTHEPGGGGINVSRVIKRLGLNPLTFYTSGDTNGKMLGDLLQQEELYHKPIKIDGLTRENLIVLDKSSEEQYRFCMPGPHIKEKEWKNCLKKIEEESPKPEYIVASGSLPPNVPEDFYARLAHIANNINSKFILDTKGTPLRLAAMEGVYLLKPNMREFQQITLTQIGHEMQLEEEAMKLIEEDRVEVLVVSLGAGGILMATKNGTQRLPSPTVPIRSRVGAGDSMVGGIVYSLAKNRNLDESIKFGVAAGAAATMTPGTELCKKEDTEKLYNKLNNIFKK